MNDATERFLRDEATGLVGRLDRLLRLRNPGSRVLVTGWFSFLDGEVTAGDALAERAVAAALDHLEIQHDTAWSPAFAPESLTLEAALPEDYEVVVFVCGPLHGERLAELHRRYASCRRVAIGVSVLSSDDAAVRGFHEVVARDGPDGTAMADLAANAPARAAPAVAGVALTYGQGEYGNRRNHDRVGDVLLPWLAAQDCARIEADTRLARDDWHHCRTPDQYLSLVGRLDVMITDRLHGLVLALRAGIPALVVDPVEGGAKVTAQARLLRWPALLRGETLLPELLDHWWAWCLSSAGSAAARRRRTWLLGDAGAEESVTDRDGRGV
ncbi:polysaccharide pyruvyl transferase family protein [Streptomyces sp. NPDC008125]|uniref:polysaccharide pyruvyl transferase family protein n=1 Tax=Streptomyces sp. NPDC008125 TaxID=3364811 RepID=UPI0036F0E66E